MEFDFLAFANKHRTLCAVALVALCVLGFYFTRSPAFSIVGFFSILLLVFVDLFYQASEPASKPSGGFKGAPQKDDKDAWKKSLVELAQALGLAVIAWLALQYALQTNAPIDVVTSCSMLPALERGDLIFVKGGAPNAPVVNFSGSLDSLKGDLFAPKSECIVVVAGKPVSAVCTTGLLYKSITLQTYPPTSNDIVVFEPRPREYGLIVHRAVARFYNGTNEFLFTKGDNNQLVDQESRFLEPVPKEDLKGSVLFRIPLVGFLKLFLFMQFEEPPGCKQVLQAGS